MSSGNTWPAWRNRMTLEIFLEWLKQNQWLIWFILGAGVCNILAATILADWSDRLVERFFNSEAIRAGREKNKLCDAYCRWVEGQSLRLWSFVFGIVLLLAAGLGICAVRM